MLITLEHINKTYSGDAEDVVAVDDVSVSVEAGEFVAVVGPSGCGKTTLLNCLSGIDSINNGNIEIGGKPIQKLSDNALSDFRAHFMGFVFQTYNLLPVLTAQENVELPLLISGHSQKAAKVKALESLSAVNLADWSGQRPSELSGGQQQRVALARALVNDPAIVWADEPTGNLDSQNEREIMELITRLNKENGQTFVLVTHSDSVGAQADRIVYMRDGYVDVERV